MFFVRTAGEAGKKTYGIADVETAYYVGKDKFAKNIYKRNLAWKQSLLLQVSSWVDPQESSSDWRQWVEWEQAQNCHVPWTQGHPIHVSGAYDRCRTCSST